MQTINLPKSWKEITLKMFSELDTIFKYETMEPVDKDIKVLSMLTGNTTEELLAIPFKTKNELLRKIRFLNDLTTINTNLRKHFIIKGKRFRLTLNATELTGGQYIDLMTFLKDPEAVNQNIHNVLAVLASPLKYGFLKTRYKGKEHAARAKFFNENMPISIAYPVLLFFCNLSGNLTMAMATYLQREITGKTSQIQLRMQDIMAAMAGS